MLHTKQASQDLFPILLFYLLYCELYFILFVRLHKLWSGVSNVMISRVATIMLLILFKIMYCLCNKIIHLGSS